MLSADPGRRPQGDFCHGLVLKEAPSKALCKQHATSADLAGPCHLLPAPSRWRGAAVKRAWGGLGAARAGGGSGDADTRLLPPPPRPRCRWFQGNPFYLEFAAGRERARGPVPQRGGQAVTCSPALTPAVSRAPTLGSHRSANLSVLAKIHLKPLHAAYRNSPDGFKSRGSGSLHPALGCWAALLPKQRKKLLQVWGRNARVQE